MKFSDEMVEEVDHFMCLGTTAVLSGGVKFDASSWMNEGYKLLADMKKVIKNCEMDLNLKRKLHENMIIFTVMSGLEIWALIH